MDLDELSRGVSSLDEILRPHEADTAQPGTSATPIGP